MVADDRPRQTGIGHHAIFDDVAKLYKFGHIGCLYFFTAETLTWFKVSGVSFQKTAVRRAQPSRRQMKKLRGKATYLSSVFCALLYVY
jgi:hypothetical protein